MVKVRLRFNWFAAVLFVLFLAAIIYGIARDEIFEVRGNATIICLSCIGIE